LMTVSGKLLDDRTIMKYNLEKRWNSKIS
jgi:hypothetical protein